MEEIKRVYVKSSHNGIEVKHYNPTFKYLFESEPLLVNQNDADFLVEDNPAMFSIVKGHKPKATKKVLGIDLDKASKDELLDFTAQHDIKADYSMSVIELRKIIKEAI